MKKGDKIYIVNKYGKFLKKITNVGANLIEWHFGYARIKDIEKNSDNKSKVKYIINQ